MTPIRCTQNPTMGEEWRKGWHPETAPPRSGSDSVLVIGAGPSGLECARLLGRRGYTVHLAEAAEELGGRVTLESRLPGLAAWARVRDYRVNQLNKMQNVEMLRGSRVTADEVLEFGATRVVIATGSHWRRDGIGRANSRPDSRIRCRRQRIHADELMNGALVSGPIVVFDDDHYYWARCWPKNCDWTDTKSRSSHPAERVSAWTANTLEQHSIQKRVLELGIEVYVSRNIVEFNGSASVLECTYTGRQTALPTAAVVTVTARLPNDELAASLNELSAAISAAGIVSITSIGDCLAPSTIAAAVYAGHRYGREFDGPAADEAAFHRELTDIRMQ